MWGLPSVRDVRVLTTFPGAVPTETPAKVAEAASAMNARYLPRWSAGDEIS